MNNYEWIKSRTMEEMALVLSGLATRTYEEIRNKLAPDIPLLKDTDIFKLFNENMKMLNEKAEEC